MKTYLIRAYELGKFKEYLTLNRGNVSDIAFYTKAWVSSISEDGKVLKLIVSEERPDVLFSDPAQIPLVPRTQIQDELEPESRKDNLWGDLKLLAKKAIREGKHRIDHYQEVQAKSIFAPINLIIEFRGDGNEIEPKPGEAYYFKISLEPAAIPITDYLGIKERVLKGPVMRSYELSVASPTGLAGTFMDFLDARLRRRLKMAAVIACVVIPGCIYVAKQASVSEQERIEHESRLKQQKEAADRRSDELNKKREDSMAKLKEILERRGDIGLLVDSTNVGWSGRGGGPVTANNDGTITEERPFLDLWPRSNWQSVPYAYRLGGLKKICGIWGKIWGLDKNGEAEVRLFRDPYNKEEAPIGGCKGEGDAWLSKTIAQASDVQPEYQNRRPAHRRRGR